MSNVSAKLIVPLVAVSMALMAQRTEAG